MTNDQTTMNKNNEETQQRSINIYRECSTYYEYVLALARNKESLKKLLEKPVVYKGENNISAVYNILEYRVAVTETETRVNFYTAQIPLYAATIMEAFKTAGVPPNKQIETIYCGDLFYRYDVSYWYDDYDQLHHEMKKKWKA